LVDVSGTNVVLQGLGGKSSGVVPVLRLAQESGGVSLGLLELERSL